MAIQSIEPGGLPSGAKRDSSGRIYYPGGISNTFDQSIEDRLKSMGLLDRYNQIRSGKLSSPKLQPSDTGTPDKGPIDVSNLGDETQFNVPETQQMTPDLSSATSSLEYMRILQQQQQEEADRLRKEKEEAEAQQEAQPKTFTSFLQDFLGKKSPEDFRTETAQDIGFKPEEYFAERAAEIAEVDKLYEDYNNTLTSRDKALLDKEQQLLGLPGGILRGEKDIINRQYNIELNQKAAQINTKLAIMEMKQDNFQEADAFLDKAVANYLAPLEADYQVYQQFRAENAEKIKTLDTKYQKALDRAEAAKFDELRIGEEIQNEVARLIKETGGKAGIEVGDTLEDAREKYNRWLGSQPATFEVPKIQNFGTSDNPDWRQFNSSTGQWEQVSGVTGAIDTREFIQDPTNPFANIPNPNFGQPISRTKEGVQTLTGKPLTDAQALSLGYGKRMADADVTITELGDKFTGIWGVVAGNRFAPNVFKSADRQRYEQAQRNFVNAVLRKESGAAIAAEEFESAAKQYFPQPGDSDDVILQKEQNRARAIQNMATSANVPLSEITGGIMGETAPNTDLMSGTIIEYNGKRYKVEANGDLTPQ